MSDAIWAARLGDGLEHTSMMADIVGGVLEVAASVAIGALATAAVVAATGITVATGGLGACLLGAVVGLVVGVGMAKTGAETGLSRLCEGIGNGLFPPTIQATITTGSLNTRTNNRLAARAGLAKRRPTGELRVTGARLLLDAAFLVPRTHAAPFEALASHESRRLARQGDRLMLSGPWPPYSFMQD